MERYVARQPIFDRHRRVHAYELLFRSGPENVFRHHDPDQASSEVIDTAVQGLGFRTLTGNRRAFINVTRQVLLDELYTLLPPDRVVVELLETVKPDDDVVAACRTLKERGYTLALDDFVFEPGYERLVELADIIKVDFVLLDRNGRARLQDRLQGSGIQLLAEKVESYDEFSEAVDLGYELFQGYFFCRPQMLEGQDIPRFKINYLRFIEEVNRPDLELERLAEVIEQELSLSVKLLRYLNSAAFGWRHDVASIEHAVRLLGEEQIRRWASLVAMMNLGEDKPAELAVSSLVRARFCESLGSEAGLKPRESELFLVGLLSHVDAFLDRPLAVAVAELGIGADVRQAILENGSPLTPVFATATAFERGQWTRIPVLADAIDVPEAEVAKLYYRSIEWTDQALGGAGGR